MNRNIIILLTMLGISCIFAGQSLAWTPKPVASDALVRMPGTQPAQNVSLEAPNRCFNCHAGYNTSVEPGFNWQGSMMAQAARDFIFWSCMTVAAQDSIWAVGTPDAVDLCERCHFPMGWLGGRSDPPNASAMTGADYDGVHCDFCHQMYDPFFKDTYDGNREGNAWTTYWDETNLSTTPSQAAANATLTEDSALAKSVLRFDSTPFFGNAIYGADYPFGFPAYRENGSGQYFVSGGGQKRASFADANARHQFLYSRYHKSKYMCGTCHDVSNPALKNLGHELESPLPTESSSAYSYFHVERTFSEFMLSDYGKQGGAPGAGPFAPGVFETSLANNYISRCQDCHMRDVTGVACNKAGVPVRKDGSTEHPQSGQPLHDLTGGNAFVGYVLASSVPGSPNYDPVNETLLKQGPAALTLDLTQGLGLDPASLLAGVDRAKQQLGLAASIENASYNSATGALTFRVRNQTGHRLISGFPEGRRMFVNVQALYSGGTYEVNPFDNYSGTLRGLPKPYSPNSPAAGPDERYEDSLVYEVHPSSSLTGEAETFHFVLADGRHKDNRIPPKGFRIADAPGRFCMPVVDGVDAPGYYTAAEYTGGYDDVALSIPPGAYIVWVRLYYQTTSREYMEFLRDEINGTGGTLTGTGAGGDPAYIAQTDPFFGKLKAWGGTIWQLWRHNMAVPGAAPVLMAEASASGAVLDCLAGTSAITAATGDIGRVSLTWTDVHTANPNILGYRVYYDQSGKSQLVAELGRVNSYTDTGLTAGQTYCYKVTSFTGPDCESAPSNVACATTHSLTLSADTASPALIGDNVLFTASRTGGTGDFEYRYWLRDTSGAWNIVRPWSTVNTWQWQTAGMPPGAYRVAAYTRHVGSAVNYETFAWMDFKLVEGVGPARLASLTINNTPKVGAVSRWTATPLSGSGVYQYRFWVKNPAGAWTLMQGYSSLNTFDWTPAASGSHQVVCQIRNVGSTATYEDQLNSGYFTVLPAGTAPATLDTLTPDSPSGTKTAPTTVTWTANEFTTQPGYEYRWWVYDGVSWTLAQGYSASNTFGQVVAAPGTYKVTCQVRNAGSTVSYDAQINSGPYVVQ